MVGNDQKTGSSVASNLNNNTNQNMLPRMLDSLGISDYSSSGSQRGNKMGRIGSSALYGNPNTLLGGLGSNFHDQGESPRVCHEHSDSGLGAEQDCTYGSER